MVKFSCLFWIASSLFSVMIVGVVVSWLLAVKFVGCSYILHPGCYTPFIILRALRGVN